LRDRKERLPREKERERGGRIKREDVKMKRESKMEKK
jgi:hypothetical protein